MADRDDMPTIDCPAPTCTVLWEGAARRLDVWTTGAERAAVVIEQGEPALVARLPRRRPQAK